MSALFINPRLGSRQDYLGALAVTKLLKTGTRLADIRKGRWEEVAQVVTSGYSLSAHPPRIRSSLKCPRVRAVIHESPLYQQRFF